MACAAPPRSSQARGESTGRMIKNFLTAKVTSAAASQFVVFGLKMIDAHATALRIIGLTLCAASVSILVYGWMHHSKESEAKANITPVATGKNSRRNRPNRRHTH